MTNRSSISFECFSLSLSVLSYKMNFLLFFICHLHVFYSSLSDHQTINEELEFIILHGALAFWMWFHNRWRHSVVSINIQTETIKKRSALFRHFEFPFYSTHEFLFVGAVIQLWVWINYGVLYLLLFFILRENRLVVTYNFQSSHTVLSIVHGWLQMTTISHRNWAKHCSNYSRIEFWTFSTRANASCSWVNVLWRTFVPVLHYECNF